MRSTRFKRLGLLYLIALLGIALSIITSQSLVQRFIGNQEDDSRVINVAGRQRMLSQKISKLILKIQNSPETQLVDQLDSTITLFTKSHQGLLNGDKELGLKGRNSDTVKSMFSGIQSHHNEIVDNAKTIISTYRVEGDSASFERNIDQILDHEHAFLINMDRIVFQYDDEAKQKVSLLSRIELILFIISMGIIVLELLFIFRPIAKNVSATIEELTKSEKSSNQMAKEMSKLYDELVKSYQDLESVDVKPESARLLANIKSDGTFLSDKNEVYKILGVETAITFHELLKSNDYADDFIAGLFNKIENGSNWNGELKLINDEGDFVWLDLFLVPLTDRDEVKIIGRDITEVKEAKMISREINSDKIARKVKEQQYRSVLILEGQEEERKRLARELHDGVGQMLSALKMSVEAVNVPTEPIHNRKRFDDTKYLLKRVIQEIRRISFNLIPTNLADFGIVPAVKRFCLEVSKLSNTTVVFENKSSFINRLENHVESNLYRIIQEAVNNSIKYSKAKTIHVSFEHTLNSLKISIEDNGKGFDLDSLSQKGHFKSSGHGIFNMKERAAFINAEMEIETAVNSGTKICVSLPLE
ncbi:MAG: histidine kinase [Bacteroidota bacterium]